MIRFRNKLCIIIFPSPVICTILIIFLFGNIDTCFSESFTKNVELSQANEKPSSEDEDPSGELLASSSLRSTTAARLSGSIKINETNSDHYETSTSEEDGDEEDDHPYDNSTENEIDTENETLEKSETFNDPDIKAIGSRLTKRWQEAFHRTRKAILGAPRYIIVRYHKTFGNLLGIKHKKEKKKKHKKKKHHHHHHESEEK